jgi:hypothetical protein
VATFDKAVQAGTGSIALYKADDTLVESIAVTDMTAPGTVTFSGTQVTIDPSDPFETGQDYYVLIDSNAITDTSGNPFEGIADKTAWNFSARAVSLEGSLGVLDLSANGGINPATGAIWEAGDTYRLLFVTRQTTNAVSSDINTYNSFVQGVAASSTAFPRLGDGSWKIVASTPTMDARDNTATNPGVDGAGEAVFLMDGSTAIATSYIDLWNGLAAAPNLDENANFLQEDRAFTGSNGDGTGVTNNRELGGSDPNVRTGHSNKTGLSWMVDFNVPATSLNSVFAMSDPLMVVEVGGGDFTDWIAGFDVGAQTGFDQDPDGDGIKNGVENYFGTHPGEFSQGLASGTLTGSTFTFTHPINAAPANDLTAGYRWSKDLASFHADGGTHEGTTVSFSQGVPSGGKITVTATITGSPIDRLFVDVEVIQN